MCSEPGPEGGVRVSALPRRRSAREARRHSARTVRRPIGDVAVPMAAGPRGNLHCETSEILVGEREIVGPSSATSIRPATRGSRRAGRDAAGLFAPWEAGPPLPRRAGFPGLGRPAGVLTTRRKACGERGSRPSATTETMGVSSGARRPGRAPAPSGHPNATRCFHSSGSTGLRPVPLVPLPRKARHPPSGDNGLGPGFSREHRPVTRMEQKTKRRHAATPTVYSANTS